MELRRNPVSKRIFSPAQTATTKISNYYLLFFNETESYQIVGRSSIKKIDNEGSATLIIRDKLFSGKVLLAGSLEDCESELARQTRLSQQENNRAHSDTDEKAVDDIPDNGEMVAGTQQLCYTQSRFNAASSITFDEPFSYHDDEVENENHNLNIRSSNHDITLTKKKVVPNKRKQTSTNTNGKGKRVDNKIVNDNRTDDANIDCEILDLDFSILNTIEKKFSSLESQLMNIDSRTSQKMVQMTKKLDYLTASSITDKALTEAYKDEHNEIFKTEVMHEETNLLNTLATSFGDFARKTMRILFTEHELKTSVLPPSRSYLARPSLDETRFKLVNEAVRVKFKLDSTKYAAFYKNILRRKLSDFLIEERRRESTKMVRQILRSTTNTL